jgi:hypothetical protein
MNSLIIAGSLLLGLNGAAQTENDTTDHQPDFNVSAHKVEDVRVTLDQIVFIENEEHVVLGFDTEDYLPEGFDPYVGTLEDVAYVAMDEAGEVELGYDTAEYLPEGFDPHVGDLNDLAYVQEEKSVELGFDTAPYLPEGFCPHLGNYNDVAFAEAQEDIELGFDTAAYLPKRFDPHVGDLDKIRYIEMDHHFLKSLKTAEEVVESMP